MFLKFHPSVMKRASWEFYQPLTQVNWAVGHVLCRPSNIPEAPKEQCREELEAALIDQLCQYSWEVGGNTEPALHSRTSQQAQVGSCYSITSILDLSAYYNNLGDCLNLSD